MIARGEKCAIHARSALKARVKSLISYEFPTRFIEIYYDHVHRAESGERLLARAAGEMLRD